MFLRRVVFQLKMKISVKKFRIRDKRILYIEKHREKTRIEKLTHLHAEYGWNLHRDKITQQHT